MVFYGFKLQATRIQFGFYFISYGYFGDDEHICNFPQSTSKSLEELFAIVLKKLRSLSSFVFKFSNLFKSPVDLVVTGEHFLLSPVRL